MALGCSRRVRAVALRKTLGFLVSVYPQILKHGRRQVRKGVGRIRREHRHDHVRYLEAGTIAPRQ